MISISCWLAQPGRGRSSCLMSVGIRTFQMSLSLLTLPRPPLSPIGRQSRVVPTFPPILKPMTLGSPQQTRSLHRRQRVLIPPVLPHSSGPIPMGSGASTSSMIRAVTPGGSSMVGRLRLTVPLPLVSVSTMILIATGHTVEPGLQARVWRGLTTGL